MSDQVFYLFSAVLLGLVLGALFMYFASGANKDSNQTIKDLEKKLKDYQDDVVNHFEETADLVDDLTHSYKKVFDHLGKSARKLMTEEQIQQQIEKCKGNKVTLEFLTEDTTEHLSSEQVHEEEQPEILDENINEVVHAEEDTNEEVVTVDTADKVDEKTDLEQEVEMREKNIYT